MGNGLREANLLCSTVDGKCDGTDHNSVLEA